MAGNPGHQAKGNVGHPDQGQLWLGSADDVKIEIKNISQKLHEVKEKHRTFRNHESLDEASRKLSEWNEELLLFCKANRKKYMIEDKTMKLDKQRLEHEKMIKFYQDREQKLQKDLNEAIKAKENALNRLSEIQSRLLKHNNPEITDLSDDNRPTNLGAKFKQLYEDEWTDAFEFLTDTRKDRLKDEDAIKMLYLMLKKCNEICNKALKEQHVTLAQVVCDPTYLKFQIEELPHRQQPKPQRQGSGNVAKLDVKARSVHQMYTGSQQAPFAQTVPGRASGGNGKMTVQQQLWQQDNSQAKLTFNKNQQPGNPKPPGAQMSSDTPNTSGAFKPPGAQMSFGTHDHFGAGKSPGVQKSAQAPKSSMMPDIYDAEKTDEQNKPPISHQVMDGKLQTPIREFSKMVGSEVLANVKISDILPAIKKTREFPEDILQNDEVLKYLEKCFHLCWLMLGQYPPMQMDLETKPGTKYDANVFEYYTNRGTKIALVVWPPVYLHKDGPVVCKGYADCSK